MMIYLDHAATCPMRPAALGAMTDALKRIYGNASQTYPPGQEARTKLDQARTALAGTIGADWKEVFFTSGGTEGDNWALIGAAEAAGGKGHIITSSIEHHAVLHTCTYLESRGMTVSYLPVDRKGFVHPEDLQKELEEHPDTILVSVMLASNEVGTIEPVRELVETVRRFEKDRFPGKGENSGRPAGHRILFHTDAVQAYGKIPVDVKDLDVDLLSVSAHKLGGPKGIGFLYIRKGVKIASLLHGGGQESGRRAGTENVPAAVGFAAAAEEAAAQMQEEQAAEKSLQDYFYNKLRENFREAESGEETCFTWNGPEPGSRRLANNVSISFPGMDQRMLLMNLDLAGICASGGSACTTGALDPSHVLMAMTGDRKRTAGTLRFTLGPENTESEIDETIRVLRHIVSG